MVYTFAFPVSARVDSTRIPLVLPHRGRNPEEYVWHLLSNSVSECVAKASHHLEGPDSTSSSPSPNEEEARAANLLQREVVWWLHGLFSSVYMAAADAPERHTVVGAARCIRVGLGLPARSNDEELQAEVDGLAMHSAGHWDHGEEEARARMRFVRFVSPEAYEAEVGKRAVLERSWEGTSVKYAP